MTSETDSTHLKAENTITGEWSKSEITGCSNRYNPQCTQAETSLSQVAG